MSRESQRYYTDDSKLGNTLSSLCKGRDEREPPHVPNPDAMWSKSELAHLATCKGPACSTERNEATRLGGEDQGGTGGLLVQLLVLTTRGTGRWAPRTQRTLLGNIQKPGPMARLGLSMTNPDHQPRGCGGLSLEAGFVVHIAAWSHLEGLLPRLLPQRPGYQHLFTFYQGAMYLPKNLPTVEV